MPTTSPNRIFLKTPCIGRCSTVYGDSVCRGCKRFMDEVVQWNGYNTAQKTSVWQRLEQLAKRIIPEFLVVLDPNQLAEFLEHHGIRYPGHLSPESWTLHCIENFPRQYQALESRHLAQAGLRLQPQVEVANLKQLQLAIQKKIYELSTADHIRRDQLLT